MGTTIETAKGTGSCPKCTEETGRLFMKTLVQGVPTCTRCLAASQPITGPKLNPAAVDPGQDEVMKKLAAVGVKIQRAKEPFEDPFKDQRGAGGVTPYVAPIVLPPRPGEEPQVGTGSFEGVIRQALKVLEACPMPRNQKAFKAVLKATKLLQDILPE
jgi:hypothetical protein